MSPPSPGPTRWPRRWARGRRCSGWRERWPWRRGRWRTATPERSPASLLPVGQHIDHPAVRIPDEEASYAPLLVPQLPYDLGARRHDLRVHGVDVLDLHAQVGDDGGGALLGEEADLGGRVGGRRHRDDPPHVHDLLEAEQAVEGTVGCQCLTGLDMDVGHDPADTHGTAPSLSSAAGGPLSVIALPPSRLLSGPSHRH